MAPWQIAPLLAQLVAQARELLFCDQELLARLYPLVMRYDVSILRHE
jgi:hypothetical protein